MYKFGKPGTPHWHINLVTEHDLNIKITARNPALQHPFINDNSFSSPFPTVPSFHPPSPPSPLGRRTHRERTRVARAERGGLLGLSRFKSDTEIGIQKANMKLRRNGCKALGEEQFWSRARGGGGGGGREGGGFVCEAQNKGDPR